MWEITNFTSFEPKKKLLQVVICQFNTKKCIKFPKNFPQKCQKSAKLCTFIRIVWEIW